MSCELRQNQLHRSGQVGAATVTSCFYSACFSRGTTCFLARHCGSSSARPWTRPKPWFQPQWLPDKKHFIAAILLGVKLWMCPGVMWYSFGGNTEWHWKQLHNKSLFCFVFYFRSGPLLKRLFNIDLMRTYWTALGVRITFLSFL